jgi:hypothetical protein
MKKIKDVIGKKVIYVVDGYDYFKYNIDDIFILVSSDGWGVAARGVPDRVFTEKFIAFTEEEAIFIINGLMKEHSDDLRKALESRKKLEESTDAEN